MQSSVDDNINTYLKGSASLSMQNMTVDEFYMYAEAAALGLGMEDFYLSSTECINMTELEFFRLMYAYYNVTTVDMTKNEFFEITLTVGNLSAWYKFCYLNANDAVMSSYYYFLSFGSF